MDSQRWRHGRRLIGIGMLVTICALMAWAPPMPSQLVGAVAPKRSSALRASRSIRSSEIRDGIRPVSVRQLQRTDCVGITFDDGPHPEFTPKILKILERYKAKATFFMIGAKVVAESETARRVFLAGHEVGNHSFMHLNLTKIAPGSVQQEFENTSDVIEDLIGVSPEYCRPPGGNSNQHVLDAATKEGMTTVFWTANSSDFSKDSARDIANTVLKSVKPGGIILLHDTVDYTVEALPIILNELKRRKLRPVAIGELVQGRQSGHGALVRR